MIILFNHLNNTTEYHEDTIKDGIEDMSNPYQKSNEADRRKEKDK